MKDKTNKNNEKVKKSASTETSADKNTSGKKKIKLSPKAVALIATGAALLVIAVIVLVVVLATTAGDDTNFDYLTSNLSKYVEISEEDYNNCKLEIDIAKPKEDIDVDDAIIKLLAKDKGAAKHNGAMITSPVTVSAGDVVYIWYRGYLLDDEGEPIEVAGMTNFTSSAASELEIGSGGFVPGFELGLVGVNTGEYPKFERITEGEILSSHVAYISYTRLVEGGTLKEDGESATALRIDLSDGDIDTLYGQGFKNRVLAATIGEKMTFKTEIGGKVYEYSDFTVDFVTACEDNPIIVECYFPYDYSSTTLRNENARFEVYIEGVVDYEVPTFDDEYLRTLFAKDDVVMTEEMLNEYEGDTLADKYRAYAWDILNEEYEAEYETMLEEALWDYYLGVAKVKKYPKSKVDKIYDEYVADVNYQFEVTGGSLQNSYTEEYEYYEDVDSFAIAYLGLTYSQNQDWKNVLYTMSESLVKERLVLYYILREKNMIPSAAEFDKKYQQVRQEYIDEYIRQYLDYVGQSREDYSDEEYEKFYNERCNELFEYYDEEYYKEATYYEIALGVMRDWPEVSTLDQRRAYPQTK